MDKQELMSLYDYLGHAAGKELGDQVYKTAVRLKEKVDTRWVDTRTYRGKVMLYRRGFLQEYFEKQKSGVAIVVVGRRTLYN
jgi:hypothetical protein